MTRAIHCPVAPASPHLGALCDFGMCDPMRLALNAEAVTCRRCLARGDVAERFAVVHAASQPGCVSCFVPASLVGVGLLLVSLWAWGEGCGR